MTGVRAATAADIDRVVEMVVRFVRETEYRLVLSGVDEAAVAALAVNIIERAGVVFLAERQGRTVGFLAVYAVMRPPLGGDPYAEELGWWMDPEARGGRAGYQMLCAAEEWATANGLSYLKMVAPFGSRICTFYTKAGYAPVETAFIKRFSDGGIHESGPGGVDRRGRRGSRQ